MRQRSSEKRRAHHVDTGWGRVDQAGEYVKEEKWRPRMNCRRSAWLYLFAIGIAAAQPSPPNDAGFSFQSFEFTQETSQAAFWDAVVGGPSGLIMSGRISLVAFRDTRFSVPLISQKPAGGTAGSVVDHLGLRVKDFADTLARLKTRGIKIEQNSDSMQVFVYSPDGLKIELISDPLIAERVRWDHIHFYTEAPEQMRSWYEKMFGAIPDDGGPIPAADLPGIRLFFSKSEFPTAPTKGRVIDRGQLRVADFEQIRVKLRAEGAELEPPMRFAPPQSPTFARLTDPWGTYIELVATPVR